MQSREFFSAHIGKCAYYRTIKDKNDGEKCEKNVTTLDNYFELVYN